MLTQTYEQVDLSSGELADLFSMAQADGKLNLADQVFSEQILRLDHPGATEVINAMVKTAAVKSSHFYRCPLCRTTRQVFNKAGQMKSIERGFCGECGLTDFWRLRVHILVIKAGLEAIVAKGKAAAAEDQPRLRSLYFKRKAQLEAAQNQLAQGRKVLAGL